MYYQVPANANKGARLKPIFPWEEYAPKATRVFPDEQPPSPDISSESKTATPLASTVTNPSDTSGSSDKTQESVSSATSEADQFGGYSRTNAWDEMPEIERYVQALHASQRRGKVQVLHQSSSSPASQPGAGEASGESRRPSMRLTDFPTEVERPSLPVTPAPRRPSFWGEERDEAGDLPAAEGVPSQKDWVSFPLPAFASAPPASASPPPPLIYWRCQFCGQQNPIQQLEELQKRQSEVLQNGPNLSTKELPTREMPENATKGSPPHFSPSAFQKATIGAAPPSAPPSAPTQSAPVLPKKGILKEPSFEVGFEPAEEDVDVESVPPEDTAPTSI